MICSMPKLLPVLRSQERVRKFQDYVNKDILPAKVRQELLQGTPRN